MTKDEALKLALEALNDLSAWNDGEVGGHMDEPYSAEVARRTITAIKEALAQPEQEPVAWMNDSTPSGIFARHIDGARNFGCTISLYTTPPQRKPLTDEDVERIVREARVGEHGIGYTIARAIEAAHGIKE